jgi:hypothetical protein
MFQDVCCDRFLFRNVLIVILCYLMLKQVDSRCKLKVFYFECFMCLTHMLQEHVSNVSFVFSLMLHYSCCKCFILFGRGRLGAGGPSTRHARGLMDGIDGSQWMEMLGPAHVGGVLILNRLSRLLCVAHAESQRERIGLGERPTGTNTRAEHTRGRASGWGRLAHLNVWVLATPICINACGVEEGRRPDHVSSRLVALLGHHRSSSLVRLSHGDCSACASRPASGLSRYSRAHASRVSLPRTRSRRVEWRVRVRMWLLANASFFCEIADSSLQDSWSGDTAVVNASCGRQDLQAGNVSVQGQILMLGIICTCRV